MVKDLILGIASTMCVLKIIIILLHSYMDGTVRASMKKVIRLLCVAILCVCLSLLTSWFYDFY